MNGKRVRVDGGFADFNVLDPSVHSGISVGCNLIKALKVTTIFKNSLNLNTNFWQA